MRYLAFMLLLLTTGCMSSQGSYPAHLVLHGNVTQDSTLHQYLEYYDTIATGSSGWRWFPVEHRKRAALYIDIWASSYCDSSDTRDTWQPGPCDVGDPEVVFYFSPGRGTYVYTWAGDGTAAQPDSHVKRFVGWIEAALDRYPEVDTIFLDDWGVDRFWWDAPDSLKAAVWPGYPSNSYVWPQVQLAERLATQAIFRKRGKEGRLICNGSGSRLPTTIHFHEKVGTGWYTWDRLLVEGVDPYRYIEPGTPHILMLAGIDAATGKLTAKGEQDMAVALRLVKERGPNIGIGLCFESNPHGSIYNYLGDPREWPGY